MTETIKTYTKYEYTTFVLADYPHPLAQSRKINADLAGLETLLDTYKDFPRMTCLLREFNTMLQNLLVELDKKHDLENLDVEEGSVYERQYWIDRLAREAGLQLMASGKISLDTLTKMTSLDNVEYNECVRKMSVIANDLNTKTKNVEDKMMPKEMK